MLPDWKWNISIGGNDLTYEVELWHMSKDWNSNLQKSNYGWVADVSNISCKILPQTTTYFEYFNNTITPYFEVYPKTYVVYEVDKSFYDNNTYLSLKLSTIIQETGLK